MTGKWAISGVDLYANYGCAIVAGSYLSIMSPPKPRKRLEYEYTDANGLKVDVLTALTYEPNRFVINIVITGASFSAFWNNYNAFLAAVAKPGTFTLYVQDLGITCVLLYEGMTCTEKPGSLRSGRVAAKFALNVLEPNPKNRS